MENREEIFELLNSLLENKKYAEIGGNVAKVARDELESKLGKTVITKDNNLTYQYEEQKLLEESK